MRGRGRFVADIRLAGMMEAAFVRSPLAHARLGDIEIPDEAYGRVVTAAEMADVKPIRAVSALPGFKPSEQPVLARGKVRHVGEPIALCWADDRALAEDLAAAVLVDFDELPVVSDMLDGRREAETRVHEAWSDNVCLETLI
ncbi:MAG: xanthine dehydrogenase family protein molybdopterin-binding subunit, partial [Candidatus Krumholzibacteria bacterium]|nr:xanthine dehydrogenase family protein molybdopterin-binding subunit [Candidatus Krumholzibacteria bacterium]